MSRSDLKIKFLPMGVEVALDPEKSLLQIAHENDIKIKSICNGTPSCAECRVKIVEGEHSIPKPTPAELNLIGTSYYLDGRRLSCQVHCFGPVSVDVTEQLNKIDTQKKIKGVRLKDQKEIHAKQDTMILAEENKESGKKPESTQEKKAEKDSGRDSRK